MDKRKVKGVDIVHDLEEIPYPLKNNEADELLARHIIEHLDPKKIIDIFNEWWRILKPDGRIIIVVPGGRSDGYIQDPTHTLPVNHDTFKYFDPAFDFWTVYKPKPWEILKIHHYTNGFIYVEMKKITSTKRVPRVCLIEVEDRAELLAEYHQWVVRQIQEKKIHTVISWTQKRQPIWILRRKMIEGALRTGCTHVLQVDTDVAPPEGFIDKLLAHNHYVVSGVYCDIDGTPVSRRGAEYVWGKGLEEVDFFSMGASLIKREVLEKVKYPDSKWGGIDADQEFCQDIRKAGFQIMQDFDLLCQHIKLVRVPKWELKRSEE